MTLVDSSVWIDFFRGIRSDETARLISLLQGPELVVTGDLIVAEVLQGFDAERDFGKARALLTEHLPVVGLVGTEVSIQAARNYRALRARGVTIRKTIDTLIATYCIENRVPLLFSDRDFRPFVEHLGLQSALHDA